MSGPFSCFSLVSLAGAQRRGSLDPPDYLGGGGGGMPGGGGGIPQFCGLLITRGWYAMPAGTGTEWPLTYMHWM